MSSPNSKRVMPNWNAEPRTSNSPDTDKNPESLYSIKRRSFDPLSPEAQAKHRRNEDDQISNSANIANSTNGSIAETSDSPEPSDGVSSVTENNNVDVSSSDASVSQIQAVVSSSDADVEIGADSTANQPDSTTYQQTGNASSSQPRVMCRYAETCYRRNDTHREIFAHPGDSDYKLRVPGGVDPNLLITPKDDAPDCRFGATCYRKNPKHFKNNKHPLISSTGRPQRTRNRPNSPTNYQISSESEYDDDFSADEDEEYVPPDSESLELD